MLGTELDEAIQDCDKALDLQPKNPHFLDSRGWARLRRGDDREALKDYERALKIKPDLAWTLYGRGLVRIRLGEVEAGRADLEAARKLEADIDVQTGRYGLAAAAEAVARP
jgi:tetratricopeptide (TPR) repeat protein